MRLRAFEAATTQTALRRMREALGEDAVIVTTRETAAGVRITAAVEGGGDDLVSLLQPRRDGDAAARTAAALARHGLPPALLEALTEDLAERGAGEALTALATTLAARWRFAPLEPASSMPAAAGSVAPLMLVGPPGAGKTATLAKIAAAAVLRGEPIRVASTDTARRGAIAQLEALAQPLGLEVRTAAGPDELAGLCRQGEPPGRLVIDSTGIDPFRGEELARLADLLHAGRAEPVLVLPAGLALADSAEIAANFAAMGAARMITTRLDMACSLGGLLVAAEAGLGFAAASVSPLVARPLSAWTPDGLARLLLRQTGGELARAA